MIAKESTSSSVEQQKEEILHRLVGVMIGPDTPTTDRRHAKQSLRRIGNQAIVATLGEVIEESDDIIAVTDATEILGSLSVTPAVESSLLRLLWHESYEVRRSAVEALSRIGEESAASVLSILVTDSHNPASIFEPSEGDSAEQALAAIVRRSSQN